MISYTVPACNRGDSEDSGVVSQSANSDTADSGWCGVE